MSRTRFPLWIAVGAWLLSSGLFGSGALGAEPKAIQTHKSKDVVIALLSDAGQWKQGKNSFVLEFKSAAPEPPLGAPAGRRSSCFESRALPPFMAGATPSPDKAPGR